MTPLALLSGSPRRVAGVASAVAAALVLLALPGLVNPYLLFQACLVMVTATAGLGLVLIMGWSGQIALSQAGFLGVGAYATTYLVAQGWAWPLAAVTAGLVAALFGVLIGLLATRLRGFYLAIATLAFAELMIRVFVEATPVTGGIARHRRAGRGAARDRRRRQPLVPVPRRGGRHHRRRHAHRARRARQAPAGRAGRGDRRAVAGG
ncbi:branched-chain amino acid ABC transporter permease [Nonomuraea ferruginea]